MSLESIIDEVLSPTKPAFGAGKEPGEQGSVEWLMERCGLITASRFKDAMDFLKSGKPGAKRTAYLWELVYERLTGKPAYHAVSYAMERGTELEPMARMSYESFTGNMVMETGFHKHPTLPYVGGSPDGLIDDEGGCEFKCPMNPEKHLSTFLTGMDEDHAAQVQGLMWITGRKWWDFGSYNPDIPAPHDLYVQRVDRDDEYIAKLETAVITLNDEANEILAKLKEAA